jgi:hypothetical protein
MDRKHRHLFYLLIPVLLFAIVLSACGGTEPSAKTAHAGMPDYVQHAPARVQEAYVYAVNHPGDLDHIPCYCGCGAMGHTSNLSCYIQRIDDTGDISYDSHAAGCGICVDITQDVMRLTKDGKSLPEIRQYIDAVYSAFGPSTDTPFPTG